MKKPPLLVRGILALATRLGIVILPLRDDDAHWHLSIYKPRKD